MEKDAPLVSVVIPTHNRPERLGKAIASVLGQTCGNYEVVVVDDSIVVDSRNVVEGFGDSRLRYIRNEKNLGAALTRNIGINSSRGEYIAFLDDDDEFMPDKLRLQLEKFRESSCRNLAFVYCRALNVDTEGGISEENNGLAAGNAIKYHLLTPITSTSCILAKKAVLDEVGGFRDLRYGDDYELILRILGKGYEIDYVDELLIRYHVHEGERISTNNRVIEGKNEIFEIRKRYFDLLTQKEVKRAYYEHYISIFRILLERKGRLQALGYLLKAFGSSLFCLKNLKELAAFVLGHTRYTRLKAVIKARWAS